VTYDLYFAAITKGLERRKLKCHKIVIHIQIVIYICR